MLKAAVNNGPHELRFQKQILKARRMNPDVVPLLLELGFFAARAVRGHRLLLFVVENFFFVHSRHDAQIPNGPERVVSGQAVPTPVRSEADLRTVTAF